MWEGALKTTEHEVLTPRRLLAVLDNRGRGKVTGAKLFPRETYMKPHAKDGGLRLPLKPLVGSRRVAFP